MKSFIKLALVSLFFSGPRFGFARWDAQEPEPDTEGSTPASKLGDGLRNADDADGETVNNTDDKNVGKSNVVGVVEGGRIDDTGSEKIASAS